MLRGDARSKRRLPKKGFSKLVEDLRFTKVSIFQNEKTPTFCLCVNELLRNVGTFFILWAYYIDLPPTNGPDRRRSAFDRSPLRTSGHCSRHRSSRRKPPLQRRRCGGCRGTPTKGLTRCGVCLSLPLGYGCFFFLVGLQKKISNESWLGVFFWCFFWWRKIQISPPKVAFLTSKSSPF